MTTQGPTLAEQIELMNSQFYPMIQGGSEYQKAILASLRRLQAIEQDDCVRVPREQVEAAVKAEREDRRMTTTTNTPEPVATPRTDEFEQEHRLVDAHTAAYAAFEFARTLERELTAALAGQDDCVRVPRDLAERCAAAIKQMELP